MRPLITALVDTFNHERYIEQALVSVLEQDFPSTELEILVVDDGSTDRTAEIVRKFAPRVRLLRKKNGGQASAFNVGIRESRGEVIAFLDGDDWWVRNKLVGVMNLFERQPGTAAVGHGFYEFHDETKKVRACCPQGGKLLHLTTPEAAREAYFGWLFLLTSALTVRREMLDRIMPIPEALAFCADTPIAMASMTAGVSLVPEALCYYRQHRRNLQSGHSDDEIKTRRKAEMNETTFELTESLLIRLGVRRECIMALLHAHWIQHSRSSLREVGGRRVTTLRTEMRSFRMEHKNPTVGYRLFKYLFVGAATLLLPPRLFYRARDWYGRRNLGRFRAQFARSR